ncbi:uncharacterized protein LOC129570646 [Sitodiplosis mosellana]|uniref:uncharacterized protein LOC129570646 n=1 Tax=Sitodiplosis mosellana TaxID=263140 RepID=UPI0024445C4D|nr:uncharacterized protein LOC129570646 [Sitodiplosis mosellana]
MKFAVFVILACLSVCYINAVNPKIQTWGQITSRTLGTKNIVIPSSPYQSKNFTFYYPEGQSTYPIYGIQHFDFTLNSTVRFLKGGIGQRNVTLFVESQRGQPINSTFIFYA